MKIKPLENNTTIPVVTIDYEVYALMKQLVAECDKEVSWLCLVNKKDNIFNLYDLEMCEQECSGAYTGLFEQGLQSIAESLLNDDRSDELNNVRCWVHSHVNMEPSPSTTDNETFEEYYKACGDYFIRMIMNKKGNYTLTLADVTNGVIYDDLKYTIVYKDNKAVSALNELSKLKVKIEELKGVIEEYEKEITEKSKEAAKEMVKVYVKDMDKIVTKSFTGLSGMNRAWNYDGYDDYHYNVYSTDDEITEYEIENLLYEMDDLAVKTGIGEKSIVDVLSVKDIIKMCNKSPADIKKMCKNIPEFKDYKWKDWENLKKIIKEAYDNIDYLIDGKEIIL